MVNRGPNMAPGSGNWCAYIFLDAQDNFNKIEFLIEQLSYERNMTPKMIKFPKITKTSCQHTLRIFFSSSMIYLPRNLMYHLIKHPIYLNIKLKENEYTRKGLYNIQEKFGKERRLKI